MLGACSNSSVWVRGVMLPASTSTTTMSLFNCSLVLDTTVQTTRFPEISKLSISCPSSSVRVAPEEKSTRRSGACCPPTTTRFPEIITSAYAARGSGFMRPVPRSRRDRWPGPRRARSGGPMHRAPVATLFFARKPSTWGSGRACTRREATTARPSVHRRRSGAPRRRS